MPGRIHHIDLSVSNLARATCFYDFYLSKMGFTRIDDVAEGPLWAGDGLEIGLRTATSQIAHDRYAPGLHHLAFWADSAAAVDELFEEIKRRGDTVLDAPAEYPDYTQGYYALFFADPDGFKLEYVYTPEWPI